MKRLSSVFLICLFLSTSLSAQIIPDWVSGDTSMMIFKGSGAGWTYGGGSWSPTGQIWLGGGMVNNPLVNTAWAEFDLSSLARKSKYIYIVWHKNGIYIPHAAHYELSDINGIKVNVVIDETKHANGLDLSNDTFSGWYPLSNKKISLTPTSKLRAFKDTSATTNEYLQADAVMLSDYPVIGNASPGSNDNFGYMNALSVPDAGPTGVGNHQGMQGLSEQYTMTPGDSAVAQLDTTVFADVIAGNYYVDVSWVYYKADSLNTMKARYSVNGILGLDTVNQNRSADNQRAPFVEGNSVGTQSGFFRLSGIYYYSPSHSLKVSAYSQDLEPGHSLVWNMVRFVPQDNANLINKNENQSPTGFSLSQNYPNPFNPSTEIKYSIPQSGFVTLKVYNLLGQEIATLDNQEQAAGNYIVNFNAAALTSGVYVYKIQSGSFSLTKKLMLLK